MYRIFKTIGVAALALMTTASCSGPGEISSTTLNDLEFNLEGPLFAGPNSGQVEMSLNLKDALGESYLEGVKLTDARLTSATVQANDTLGFSNVSSFVLSFASDNEDVSMVEAAFKNPLPDGLTEVDLDVAPEVELGEIMAEGKAYIVLDADLMEDYWDGNRNFKLNITLELTTK